MVIGIVMGRRSASLALRVPAVPITVRLYALFQIERGQFISGFVYLTGLQSRRGTVPIPINTGVKFDAARTNA